MQQVLPCGRRCLGHYLNVFFLFIVLATRRGNGERAQRGGRLGASRAGMGAEERQFFRLCSARVGCPSPAGSGPGEFVIQHRSNSPSQTALSGVFGSSCALRYLLFLQPKHGAFNTGSKSPPRGVVLCMGHFNLFHIVTVFLFVYPSPLPAPSLAAAVRASHACSR